MCSHLIGQLEQHKHLLLKVDESSTQSSTPPPGQELLYKLIELILHAMRSSTKSSSISSTSSTVIPINVAPLVLLDSVKALEKLPQLFSASLSLMYTPPIVAVLIDLLAKLNSAPSTPHIELPSQNGSSIVAPAAVGPVPKRKISSTVLLTSASPSNSASSLFASSSTSQNGSITSSPTSSSSSATSAEIETFIDSIVNTLRALLQPKSELETHERRRRY